MTSLPTKQQYLDGLQSVTDRRDQPHCPICWGDWDDPADEIVEASTQCSLHPLHKACLISTFVREDGEEIVNRCPICRRELFEKSIPATQSDNGVANFDFTAPFPWSDDPDVRLAMIREFCDTEAIPVLDEWFESEVAIDYLESLLDRPADQRLTDEGRTCIGRLFVYQAESLEVLELQEKTVDLLDHLFGDAVIQYIIASVRLFSTGALGSSHPLFVHPSLMHIAFYVVTKVLMDYGVDQNLFGKQMEMHEWLLLVRFRQLLWEEQLQLSTTDIAPYNEELRICFTISIASLLGLPDSEPMKISIESFLKYHDGKKELLRRDVVQLPAGPDDTVFFAAYDEGATVFQVGPYSELRIVEGTLGSIRECNIDRENGCIEFSRHHNCLLRLQRILVQLLASATAMKQRAVGYCCRAML